MFQALALHQSKRQRADAQDISFKALYGGQFTLSTQLITLNYPVTLSHRRSTTVSLETYQLKKKKMLNSTGPWRCYMRHILARADRIIKPEF